MEYVTVADCYRTSVEKSDTYDKFTFVHVKMSVISIVDCIRNVSFPQRKLTLPALFWFTYAIYVSNGGVNILLYKDT